MRQDIRCAVENELKEIFEALLELPAALRGLKETLAALAASSPVKPSSGQKIHAFDSFKGQVARGSRRARGVRRKVVEVDADSGCDHGEDERAGKAIPLNKVCKLTTEQAEEIRQRLKGTSMKARRQLRQELARELGVSLRQVAAASAYLTGKLAVKHKRVERQRAAKAQRKAGTTAAVSEKRPRTGKRRSRSSRYVVTAP